MLREALEALQGGCAADFERISDAIWDYAETAFREVRSARALSAHLEAHGFRVTMPLAGMDSAFVAERGSGAPVIAFLGEYDALPGLSQRADVAREDPIDRGGPGHGCGHNLLGAGAAEAALITAEYLEAQGRPGTIRYYGCPAEELGGGKAFMAIQGCFEGVDAAFTWHPYHYWDITTSGRSVASAYFRFHGVAAHALHAEQGRNAFDALELMIQGFNYLRKHVRENTILSYCVTNAGSGAANIVSDYAEGLFQMRHPDGRYLAELFSRLKDMAKGAALITGTTAEGPVMAGSYANILRNDTLSGVVRENMEALLPLSYTEEELSYGRRFLAVGAAPDAPEPYRSDICVGRELIHSDVCDVSWQAPLVNFFGVTLAEGTKPHNWGTVAQGKGGPAKKGMHAAALLMANSALDVMDDPALLERARAEFERRRAEDGPYTSLLHVHDLDVFYEGQGKEERE